MKLVFYNDFKLGAIRGEEVVDLSDAVSGIAHTSPHDLLNRLIENYAQHKADLEQAVSSGAGILRTQVKLRSPHPKPYNIVCMAVNYMENGTRDAPAPINAFDKSPHTVIGDGDTMVLPDMPATIFEGEAELALVIGKKASYVKAEDAYDYIFGYLNFIDGSARGVPAFFQMKSRHTFGPMGPYIVTADEIPDPQKLPVKLWVNGNLMQDFNTDDMAHKIPRLIEWVSSVQPLEPGDIIATGTNHRGLSAFQDGDKVEIETEGLGRLHFDVKDDLKRTWPRDTRLDRQNQGFADPVPQATGKYAPA